MDLKLLDLFSGIGGFSYAAEKIVGGYKTTQFVEIDPYCQSVLHKNFPNIPIHDDIKTFKAKKGQFDVLTAGFPCQDLSVAGRQKGIGEGTRSGLFYEIIRLLGEIQPKFVLFENVRNLLSHEKGATFQEILFQIAKAGYDAEWSIISAKDLGACHKRERIWIIAYPFSNRVQSRIQRSVLREREFFSDQFKGSEVGSEIGRCSENFANSYSNGSSSTERVRVNGETNSSSQKRENKISKSERSSESRSSGTIQQTTECKWKYRGDQLNPDWERYLSKPTLRRGDDGLSNRVARIKALGNSIVPNCAAVPLQRIKDLSEEKC
jgi:DNA (cytosine-5)-methyltransferase 1